MKVTFQAIIHKVQTMQDGGWRLTLDIPENESEQIMELSKARTEVLQVAVVTPGDEK